MIYFVQDRKNKLIKIGTSVCLERRLRPFGSKVDVLGVMPGNLREEEGLHQKFDHLRVRGEWFKPGTDLTGFISEHARPWKPSGDQYGVIITSIQGLPAYERYLGRLEREAIKRGLTIRGRAALAEYACNALGLSWGIKAPARVLPRGTNRYNNVARKKSAKMT